MKMIQAPISKTVSLYSWSHSNDMSGCTSSQTVYSHQHVLEHLQPFWGETKSYS